MGDTVKIPPQTIAANYRIEREVGRGGMAVVYRAQDIRHARTVALKVLNPDIAASLGKDRFLFEIQVAARLNHPHIVALYDSGEYEGFLYYVMPFIEGPTLRDLLNQHSRLSVSEGLRLTAQIAGALEYAHRFGIVHRDIKPGNVMIHEGEALVTDFGIAKALSSAGSSMLTQTGVVLGTPAYMSPEQAAGEPELDGRSDLYSFACVIYEMLTGQPPFTADSLQALIAKRFTSKPPSARTVLPAIPERVASAISRALSIEPRDRFETVSAFAASLKSGELSESDKPTKPSIAVLPFENMSADPENEFFSDGITEEIINSLSRIQALEVVARRSAFAYKGKEADMRTVGNQLGVRHLLSGSVRRSGNRLRISAELIDVETGYHLWSERFDREMSDVFAIQDEIAANIVKALSVMLTEKEKTALKASPSRSVRAYDYFLKGRRAVHTFNLESYKRAEEDLRRAIALDPDYAPAWANLAEICAIRHVSFLSDPEAVEQADSASRRAIELGPHMGYVHNARGLTLFCMGLNEEAETEFITAMDLDATLFDAPYNYGRLLASTGKVEQAAHFFDMAAGLNADDYQAASLAAGIYRGLGKAEEAHRAAERAMSALNRARASDPNDVRALYLGAGILHELGKTEEAERWASTAELLQPDDQATLYNLACFHSLARNVDRSISLLERTEKLGWDRFDWAMNDADLDNVRDDPRFQQLLQRMSERSKNVGLNLST